MAPRVRSSRTADTATRPAPDDTAERPDARGMRQILSRIQKHIERNFEHVGTRFAEEARAIHYGETEERGIYGNATPQENRALAEEGIQVGVIPWTDRRRTN